MISLSFLIPHFNSWASLKVLLDSIYSQGMESYEVIVVDDFSSENNDVFSVEDYGALKVISNERQKGAGGARNTAISYAKGDWLIFCDSDDFLLPHSMINVEKYLSESNDLDVVFFKPTSQNIKRNQTGTRHKKNVSLMDGYLNTTNSESRMRLLFTHYVPWSKAIKRSFVTKNDIWFDETIIANDGMFAARCGMALSKFAVSEHVYYCVTESENSLTKIKKPSNLYVRVNVFCDMYWFLDDSVKKAIGFNPMSLILLSSSYGFFCLITTFGILRERKIPIFKNLNISSIKRKFSIE